MDTGSVTVKKNRVLPFKATLNGSVPVRNLDIIALPVIQVFVRFGCRKCDRRHSRGFASRPRDSRQSVYSMASWWHFNLKTKNYTAAGTYTVSMVSGDTTEYVVGPTSAQHSL